MSNKINAKQLAIIKHSLGLDKKEKAFRNSYYSDSDCSNYKDLCDLVDQGLMVSNKDTSNEMSDSFVFFVTDAGCKFIGLNGLCDVE